MALGCRGGGGFCCFGVVDETLIDNYILEVVC